MNTIYTIGHSTRTIEQFVESLKTHHIQEAVDVRTVPKSRQLTPFLQKADGKLIILFQKKQHLEPDHCPALFLI